MLNVLTVKTIPVICNSAVKSNRHVHILANQKYLSIWFGAGHSVCNYSMFDVCSHRAFCLLCWRKCLPLDSGECLKDTPIIQISANRDFKYSNTICFINVFTVFLVPCYIYYIFGLHSSLWLWTSILPEKSVWIFPYWGRQGEAGKKQGVPHPSLWKCWWRWMKSSTHPVSMA